MPITEERLVALFEHYKIKCPSKYLFQNSEGRMFFQAIYNLDVENLFPDVRNVCRMMSIMTNLRKMIGDKANLSDITDEDDCAFIIECCKTISPSTLTADNEAISEFVFSGINDMDESGRPAFLYIKDDDQFSIVFFDGMFDWFYSEKTDDGVVKTWADILLDNGVSWNALDEELADVGDINVIRFLSGMFYQDYFRHYMSPDMIKSDYIQCHKDSVYSRKQVSLCKMIEEQIKLAASKHREIFDLFFDDENENEEGDDEDENRVASDVGDENEGDDEDDY
jgi:hypothetical protein